MPTYKISPSDLAYPLDRCPHCFRAKVVDGWKKPYTPFPSIFNKIDKRMREAYASETLITKKTRIKSLPLLIDGIEIFFSGETDAIAIYDQTIGVYDFKTSDLKDGVLELYRRQLHAYAHCFEFPAKGTPQTVENLKILSVVPVEGKGNLSTPFFDLRCHATITDIPLDWVWWKDEILPYLARLIKSEPGFQKDCWGCHLRRTGW